MQLLYSPRDIKDLFSLIDNMTNQGLFDFAEVLTGGSVKFEKTRSKMKKIIKRCLSEVFLKQNNTQEKNLSLNLSSPLMNPHNFRWSCENRFIPDSESSHTAVLKILDILEFLPVQTLSVMHRKLRDKNNPLPQLTPKKCGWGRDALIKCLRKKCMKLLSKLGDGDVLQEPLANAMEVASLTLKLVQGCHYVTSFKQVPPEISDLQNEIAMAIQLLDRKVKPRVLKEIKVLLDPKAKCLDWTLQSHLKNMLTECLFDCSDMDSIPQRLLEALTLIKQNSEAPYKHSSEAKIEEEVECILSVSASAKQILWDLIPDHELDLEFADAYMEDLLESDCEDAELEVEHTQNDMPHYSNSEEGIGSTDEVPLANSGSVEEMRSTENPLNPMNKDAMQYHVVSLINTGQMDADSVMLAGGFPPSSPDGCICVPEKNPDPVSSDFPSLGRNLMDDTHKNQYLAVQAACDETSMVAYCLIGHMLNEFAQIEGCELNSNDMSYVRVRNHVSRQKNCKVSMKEPTTDEVDGCSVIIKAAEELIPSFSEREKERLKELMGSEV